MEWPHQPCAVPVGSLCPVCVSLSLGVNHSWKNLFLGCIKVPVTGAGAHPVCHRERWILSRHRDVQWWPGGVLWGRDDFIPAACCHVIRSSPSPGNQQFK